MREIDTEHQHLTVILQFAKFYFVDAKTDNKFDRGSFI